MTAQAIAARLGSCYQGLGEVKGRQVYRGKVRDVVDLGKNLLIVASDRISAFDRVLSAIPFKGEILNRISRFWFESCADILPNHLIPDAELGHDLSQRLGRGIIARKAQMLPVEVVVRGYLTGSAYRDYQGGRPVSGIELPKGLAMSQRFETPLITPTTKESSGHDQNISREEIISSKLVPAALWTEVEEAALALFARGQEVALRRGLILVDTKYEFGLIDGRLFLCDEIHTPDSSRYWYADGYDALFASGQKQRELDKEHFRRWLMERGYSGDGQSPEIDDTIRVEVAQKYIEAFETLLGQVFSPISPDPEAERAYIENLL